MTAAFRSAISANAQAATSLAVGNPTGLADDDIMLAPVYYWTASNPAAIDTVPSGWALCPDCAVNTSIEPANQGSVYYHVAASEPANRTWGFDIAVSIIITLAAYQDGNPSDPIAASLGAEDNGGTTVDAPSVITTEDNQRVVCVHQSNWDQGTWTPDGDTTERVDVQPNLGNHNGTQLVADFIQAVAGATPAQTATLSNDNDAGIGFQVALKNAASFTTFFQTIAATAVGSAVVSLLSMYFRTLASTAVGTPIISRLSTYLRALDTTAIGVATLTKVTTFFRTLAATAVGVASLVKKMFATLAATSVGVVALTVARLVSRALAATAVGAAALSTALVASVSMAATAVGMATLAKVTTLFWLLKKAFGLSAIAVTPDDPRQPVTVSPASGGVAVSITPSQSNPPNPWLEPED
jgi:hypothetical protein